MTDLDLYTGLPKTLEVAPVDPTGGRLVAWAQAARAAHALAESLSKTSFVPKDFRGKPDETCAAILLGDELGMKPLAALASVFVIHGKPSIYAKTMVALVQSHGHEVWTESQTDREVVMGGRRRGSDRPETAKWDIDRARKAGYTTNAKYQTNPQEMLWAKAAAEVCKKIASDVLAGVPFTVEDLELEPENQPKRAVARSTSTRAVQRQEKPTPPEPDFDEPAPPAKVDAERTDGPDLITPAQSKKLHAALRDAGLGDRDKGLARISEIVGHTVESSKDLTKDQASQVIEALEAPPPVEEEPPADFEGEPYQPGADR